MQTSKATQRENPSSLTQALREETAAVHQRLHQHDMTAPLLSPHLTRSHYVQVLLAFYGFYAPCERQIDWAGFAPRIDWLKQDLSYFGCGEQSPEHCFNLPSLQTEAEQLGYLYVVEGSSLGGQVISRHLRASLGVSPEEGGQFFYAHGKKAGLAMRQLKALLEIQPDSLHQEIVRSACSTFETLEAWLTRRSGYAV